MSRTSPNGNAGNGSAVSAISLTVDNAPPAVSITERWWIWETGTLKVSPNHFLIARIQVTIQDPQKRWKGVELDFNTGKNTYGVKWDRRFADGALAPAGEYPVLAVACDVNGLCGRDSGRIVIPEVVDPRPKALARLGDTFRVMSAQAKNDSFNNKQK